eukprot:1147155-Pelagomonas_calceolata.AAC.15
MGVAMRYILHSRTAAITQLSHSRTRRDSKEWHCTHRWQRVAQSSCTYPLPGPEEVTMSG